MIKHFCSSLPEAKLFETVTTLWFGVCWWGWGGQGWGAPCGCGIFVLGEGSGKSACKRHSSSRKAGVATAPGSGKGRSRVYHKSWNNLCSQRKGLTRMIRGLSHPSSAMLISPAPIASTTGPGAPKMSPVNSQCARWCAGMTIPRIAQRAGRQMGLWTCCWGCPHRAT